MRDVRFVDSKGNQRFGTVQSFHKDAEKYEQQGKTIVADALNGQLGVIETTKLTEVSYRANDFGTFDRVAGIFWGHVSARDYLTLEQLAHEIRDLRNPNGVHKNTLFYCHVGDGYASYVVTNTHGSSCEVEWRGFCPDKWVAQPWGYGGRFRKSDVSRMTEIHGNPGFGNDDADKKLAIFQEKYADYMLRFNVIPVGMEDLISPTVP